MARKRQTAGSTLIEVLVVIVIFLVGILAVVQIFPKGLNILVLARTNSVANALSRDQVEYLKAHVDQLPEDIVSTNLPLRIWGESQVPAEHLDDEDNWKPTATTIPFGPYLAAGTLACMLFAAPIESGLKNYFRLPPPDSGPAVLSPLEGVSGLSRETPSRLN